MLLAVALMIAALMVTKGSAQTRPADHQGLISRSIDDLDVKGANINLLLSRLSAQTKIPIGLEVSPYDDLSIPRNIRLKIKHGTVGDALESIVKQNPLYTWQIRDEVVNVFPTESNRDDY